MTRDYKGRASPREQGKGRGHCLFWFAAGVLAGAFAVGLIWLQLDPALGRSGGKLATAGVPRPTPDEVPRAPVTEGLEFEFPELLRKMEVLLPDEDKTSAPPTAPTPAPEKASVPAPQPVRPEPAPTPTPARTARAKAAADQAYLLQLGSFRKAADAERLKAQLALMGVESYIQRVTINGKDTYHRVRSGPYRDRARLDQVRQMLTRHELKSIVVRWSSG